MLVMNSVDQIIDSVDQMLTNNCMNMCWPMTDEWFLGHILYTMCISHCSILQTMNITFCPRKCSFFFNTKKTSFFRKTIFLIFQKLILKFIRSSCNFFCRKFRSFKTLWTFSEHFWTFRSDFILTWRRPPPKTRF